MARPISSTAPTTTVTNLTSLGTGLRAGQHGMVGHSFRLPRSKGAVLDPLHWELPHAPGLVQPNPTVFQQVADQVRCTTVSLAGFADSGLTQAALRGPHFEPVDARVDLGEQAKTISAAAGSAEKTLVYAYVRDLDSVGHHYGCQSARWRDLLEHVDRGVSGLREILPEDSRLVVTADHGMVDIPADRRWIAQAHPELMAGVDVMAGEPRFRHLYVDSDDPRAVAQRWSGLLGAQAWVRCRDDAIDEGWFGPVDESVRDRFGDVMVAMRDDCAVLSRTVAKEHRLIGMHGSLTSAEVEIPLFLW